MSDPTAKRFDVVGLGYCSEDVLLEVDQYPARNSKAGIRSLNRSGGGQVATALVALARLGRRVAFHGRVGDDDASRRAEDQLRQAGVDVTGLIHTEGADTQQAFVVVDSSGERTIFWKRDPELEMTRHDVDQDLIRSARLVHVDGHERGALRALGIARTSGIPTCMDAERADDLQRAMVSLVDLLVAAEGFPLNLLGETDPAAALPAIRELGPREVVITLGEQGAIGFDGQEIVRAPAFDLAEPIVDSTGAGDVFHAGYIHAHLAGWTFRRKLEFANACAALSLRGIGGRSTLPTLDEVLSRLQRSE